MPTYSADNLLAARFHDARPGLELVAVVDAGLPVALVTADVLAQDRKPLPLLEEFTLRFVNANVTTHEGISGFLGLPDTMVSQTIAEHFSADLLTYAPSLPDGREDHTPLQLTSRGLQAAHELASITPVQVSLPLVYDQLLGKLRPYDRRTIISRHQAEEEGLLLLPMARQTPVESGDIPAAEINAMLRDLGTDAREVLLVKHVTQAKARRIMPAKVLIYADTDRTDIQLGLVVDGEISHVHEIALLNHGGANALGIHVDPPEQRPTLAPELERARVPLADVTRKHVEGAAIRLGSPDIEELRVPEPPHEEVRAISVFEHSDLLDEALTGAGRRILLISPWIKRAIVTTDFLSKLEGRLLRGVIVHIAHGYAPQDDGKSDPDAVRKLENLAARYSDKLSVVRLKSNHAKILIFDDVWIATSFNWLSFRGSRDRTYRMEEGTLVRGTRLADEQYARYLNQIDQDRQ